MTSVIGGVASALDGAAGAEIEPRENGDMGFSVSFVYGVPICASFSLNGIGVLHLVETDSRQCTPRAMLDPVHLFHQSIYRLAILAHKVCEARPQAIERTTLHPQNRSGSRYEANPMGQPTTLGDQSHAATLVHHWRPV